MAEPSYTIKALGSSLVGRLVAGDLVQASLAFEGTVHWVLGAIVDIVWQDTTNLDVKVLILGDPRRGDIMIFRTDGDAIVRTYQIVMNTPVY